VAHNHVVRILCCVVGNVSDGQRQNGCVVIRDYQSLVDVRNDGRCCVSCANRSKRAVFVRHLMLSIVLNHRGVPNKRIIAIRSDAMEMAIGSVDVAAEATAIDVPVEEFVTVGYVDEIVESLEWRTSASP
jgi:hypothetical protein